VYYVTGYRALDRVQMSNVHVTGIEYDLCKLTMEPCDIFESL